MSYINVDIMTVPRGVKVTDFHLDAPALHSFTDGEEVMAAATIISLLDGLDNGEYLIVSKDIF